MGVMAESDGGSGQLCTYVAKGWGATSGDPMRLTALFSVRLGRSRKSNERAIET